MTVSAHFGAARDELRDGEAAGDRGAGTGIGNGIIT